MNERIRELAEQAGITTNLDTDYFEKDPNKWVDYFAEKFAELLVQECAQLARNTNLEDVEGGDSSVLLAAKLNILNHFGY